MNWITQKIGAFIGGLLITVMGWAGYSPVAHFGPPGDILGAASGSGLYPTSTNNFQDGDTINAGDWNAIEDWLGPRVATYTDSISYKLISATSSDPGHKHTSSSLTSYGVFTNATATNLTATNLTVTNLDSVAPIIVGEGGTGTTTLAANGVIIGAGTSSVTFVAPGANGTVLTSNGTTWSAVAATGGFNTTGTLPGLTQSPGSSNIIEQQTGVLYTGPAGMASSSQPLGTGYTSYAVGIATVLFTGDSSSTIVLQECSSSAYSDCVTKATTASFNLTGNGTDFVRAEFTAGYTMQTAKYYRYQATYGNATGRIQCGDTSAMTPIAGADGTNCGAAARAAVFKLYGSTFAGNNNAGTFGIEAAQTSTMTFAATPVFAGVPTCVASVSDLANVAITSISTSSATFRVSSTITGMSLYYICLGK